MNKKQFFESLVSLLPDNSGQKIDAFNIINNIFSDIKKEFTDASLKRGFEDVEKDILSRVWMFEQICNGYV